MFISRNKALQICWEILTSALYFPRTRTEFLCPILLLRDQVTQTLFSLTGAILLKELRNYGVPAPQWVVE